MSRQSAQNVLLFISCLVVCQLAGGLGTIATVPNIPTWYASLHKPSFEPPDWLFAPVWISLYTLMAVALYKVIKSDSPDRRHAMMVFGVQLVLNAAWSFLFFEFHWLLISLIEIVALLGVIIYFCIITQQVSQVASYCFIPYILWVAFATLLNASVWHLNP